MPYGQAQAVDWQDAAALTFAAHNAVNTTAKLVYHFRRRAALSFSLHVLLIPESPQRGNHNRLSISIFQVTHKFAGAAAARAATFGRHGAGSTLLSKVCCTLALGLCGLPAMEAITGWITSTVQDLRTMNVRQLVLQTLNLGASDPHQSCCLEPSAPHHLRNPAFNQPQAS